jgi:tRNA-dihydrouridine synthase B
MLAAAARASVERGAEIIDINMGCPAKKVCNVQAGSALLRDTALVGRLLDAVVSAVSVPVTLKIRTGWDLHNRNGVEIARIAEAAGVDALAVHGRTRACAFKGAVEYDTIRAIKASVNIPVAANGDITTPERAAQVLAHTGADAVLIGRGAQGNPWIFREIRHYLDTGEKLAPPAPDEVLAVLRDHLERLYAHYGEFLGVRIARKHLSWYCRARSGGDKFWKRINRIESADEQLRMTSEFLQGLVREDSLERAA